VILLISDSHVDGITGLQQHTLPSILFLKSKLPSKIPFCKKGYCIIQNFIFFLKKSQDIETAVFKVYNNLLCLAALSLSRFFSLFAFFSAFHGKIFLMTLHSQVNLVSQTYASLSCIFRKPGFLA
jgi:hypothetical protein